MLIVRAYKKNRNGRMFWEYKIIYRDKFTRKEKWRGRKGFSSREEAERAAYEMLGYLGQQLLKES